MRSRSGNGPNKIQHSEVLSYCVFQEISGGERRELLYCIRMMDNFWMDWQKKNANG